MTFEEWLDKENATGKTIRDCINEEVDLARVMCGTMSHNLARRNLYKWLEQAYYKKGKETK